MRRIHRNRSPRSNHALKRNVSGPVLTCGGAPIRAHTSAFPILLRVGLRRVFTDVLRTACGLVECASPGKSVARRTGLQRNCPGERPPPSPLLCCLLQGWATGSVTRRAGQASSDVARSCSRPPYPHNQVTTNHLCTHIPSSQSAPGAASLGSPDEASLFAPADVTAARILWSTWTSSAR